MICTDREREYSNFRPFSPLLHHLGNLKNELLQIYVKLIFKKKKDLIENFNNRIRKFFVRFKGNYSELKNEIYRNDNPSKLFNNM